MLSIPANHHYYRSFLYVLILSLILFTSISTPSNSDETSEYLDGILVEKASLTPIPKTDRAQLHFIVTNYGRINVTLKKIISPAATKVEIFFLTPKRKKQLVRDLTILVEETLDLNSSHIVVELSGLNKTLIPGDKIEFSLIFNEFQTLAIADIH